MIKYSSVLMLALLAGCVSSASHRVKAYTGDAVPVNMALVKPLAFIAIRKVDTVPMDVDPSAGGFGTINIEMEFAAGEHDLQISYYSGVHRSGQPVTLKVNLEPAHRYIIKPVLGAGRWKPVLIDVTNKPECFSAAVGVLGGPKGCD